MKQVFGVLAFALLVIALSGLLISTGGIIDPAGTRRVLEEQGYTHIEITGWKPFAAGEGDLYSTGFAAESPAHVKVYGTVTRGWFKGATIRFE